MIQINARSDYTELILNFPKKLNAMGSTFLLQLNRLLDEIASQKESRLLVIKSAVPNVFCSGVDLSELDAFQSVEEARHFALLFDETLVKLLKFQKPLIAIIDGLAFGGGFALASAADIRIMTGNGSIAFPAGRLGAILPPAATLMLQALTGVGVCRDLLISGRRVLPEEALRLGLVNRFSRKETVDIVLKEIIDSILVSSDLALELTRRSVNQSLLSDIEKYNHTAAENFAFLSATEEWKRRMANFVNGNNKM